MEKVEIQITKGLTEETTEEITLLGHILENADGLKVFSELINHVISENAESILLEKKKLGQAEKNKKSARIGNGNQKNSRRNRRINL